MITWAAILVLQGAEGGVGEHEGKRQQSSCVLAPEFNCISDIALVQNHLEKLRKTKRPTPSLHHMLANRLQSWLDNMNMSPTANLVQPHFDPTWSLFDQNSIQLASDSYYQQCALDNGASVNTHESAPQPHDASIAQAQQQQQNFGDPGLWGVYGQTTNSWPSNFTRLFSNTGYQETTDNEHGH
jgi:hypothetical protein